MTREDLKSIPALASSIAYKEEALRDLRDAAISLSSPELGMRAQRGTYSDRTGTFAGRIIDLEAEIRNEYLRLAELRLEALNLFKALPDLQRAVMGLRYVVGLPWQDVADAAGIVEDYCFTLRRKSLKALFDDTQPSPVQTPNEGQLQK